MTTDSIDLELPAAPEFAGTARIFAASVARQFGAEEEAVADVKVAVSEVCNFAIDSSDPDGGKVRISIRPVEGKLEFEIEAKAESLSESDYPEEDTFGNLGQGVVLGLFPDTTFTELGEHLVRTAFKVDLRSSGSSV